MLLFTKLKFVFFQSFNDFILCFFNISQFRFVNSLYINILILFTNLIILKRNLLFSYDFSKFALYNKYNIKKNNNFYNMFTLILRFVIM